MTDASDRLSEIAQSLNRLQWQPTADEVAFGSTFFRRMKELEEEPRPTFPRGTNWWDRLRTESFDTLARVVVMVQDELLPDGRERLADSPMAERQVVLDLPEIPNARSRTERLTKIGVPRDRRNERGAQCLGRRGSARHRRHRG